MVCSWVNLRIRVKYRDFLGLNILKCDVPFYYWPLLFDFTSVYIKKKKNKTLRDTLTFMVRKTLLNKITSTLCCLVSMQYFTHFTIVISSGLRRLNIQTPGHGVHVSLLYWMTGAWWMHYQLPGHGVPSPLFTPIITTTSSSLYPTPPFHLSFINTRPPHPFIPLTGQMLTLTPSLTWPLYDPQNFRIMLHTNVWSK